MKYLVRPAVVLAVAVPGLAGSAHARVFPVAHASSRLLASAPACDRLYSVAMAKRAIDVTSRRGERRHDVDHLRRFIRCQRNPGHSQSYLRGEWARQRARWRERTAPPPAQVASSTPASGLAVCIIHAESGGNSQAVNGQYEGIAQWSPSSWAGGGGLRFASTPLGASYSEQVIVLNEMLANGQASQWTCCDPC